MPPGSLADTLGFTPADLTANQNGQLSPRQRRQAWDHLRQQGRTAVRRMAILIPACILFIALVLPGDDRIPRLLPALGIGLLVGTILGLLLPTQAGKPLLFALAMLAVGNPRPVEGVARLWRYAGYDKVAGDTGDDYALLLDDHKLVPPAESMLDAFADGVRYRVYVLPGFDWLLSAEGR